MLSQLKKKLKSTTSGVFFRGSSGLSITLYFWMMFSASLACIVFAIYDFVTGKELVALILFGISLITMSSVFLVYQKTFPEELIYGVSSGIFFVLFLFLTYNSEHSIERLLWCYTYPVATIFVLGVRRGVAWSGLLLCAVTFELLFILRGLYSQSFLLTFVVVYISITLITSWVEFYKNLYYEKIKSQHARLKQEIEQKLQLEQKLTVMSQIDDLSGLPNQRHFWTLVEEQKKAAKKAGWSICMAIIDIDNFKQINDNHGHPKGDEVIRAVAQKIRQHVGRGHLAGRIGGDEFAILFVNQESNQSYQMANQLRAEIAVMRLDLPDERKVTVSIGLAKLKNAHEQASSLYKNADLALYEAKNNGRNQVVKKVLQ